MIFLFSLSSLGLNFRFFYSNAFIKLFFFYKKKVCILNLPINILFLRLPRHQLLLSCSIKYFSFLSLTYRIKYALRGMFKIWSSGIFLTGLGFRLLKLTKNSLVVKLGYSHLVKLYFPLAVTILKPSRRPTRILFFSTDRFHLSRLLSIVRLCKSPDNYKGKGFQLFGELVSLKKREKFGSF